jgi:hypothetical protein
MWVQIPPSPLYCGVSKTAGPKPSLSGFWGLLFLVIDIRYTVYGVGVSVGLEVGFAVALGLMTVWVTFVQTSLSVTWFFKQI